MQMLCYKSYKSGKRYKNKKIHNSKNHFITIDIRVKSDIDLIVKKITNKVN